MHRNSHVSTFCTNRADRFSASVKMRINDPVSSHNRAVTTQFGRNQKVVYPFPAAKLFEIRTRSNETKKTVES